MRVLHVIPSLAACHGGPSVALPIIERALTREGVDVTTLTTDDDGPGRRNDRGDGQPRQENGVMRRYFSKQLEFYKVSLPLARWVKRHVRDFDVVHVHALFSYTSVATCRAAAAAGVPYVIRPLGTLTRYGITQRRAGLKRFCLKWIDGPLIRRAAAIHFTHDDERREAEALGIPFRPQIVPLGLEKPIPLNVSPAPKKRVLFLSRIDPKKNIESLLEAWRTLGKHAVDWRLVVAGSGDAAYVAHLKRITLELGIASQVDWPGHVAGEDKAKLVGAAAIFVLPSHSENFGIAAAEALLAGKPCIFAPGVAIGLEAARAGAADLGGPDSLSLAKALQELIDTPARRDKLSCAAVDFATRELSAEVMGRRLKAMYESVLSNRSAS